MSHPLRIGVIGAGAITRARHLPGFRGIKGVRLVAVCNRSETSSRSAALEWDFERIARSPMEIIRAEDIDAVVIGTWPYLHRALSCAALEAGKHVLTQARMARDLGEARQMLAAARRHRHLTAMICACPYGARVTRLVKKLLRQGFIGRIRLVQFHSLNSAFAAESTAIHCEGAGLRRPDGREAADPIPGPALSPARLVRRKGFRGLHPCGWTGEIAVCQARADPGAGLRGGIPLHGGHRGHAQGGGVGSACPRLHLNHA